jgi:3-methylcrotonyl-CoA carboxylase alpha subunit
MARSLTLRDARGAYAVAVGDDGRVRVDEGEPIGATLAEDGTVRIGGRVAYVAATGDTRWVFLDGEVFRFDVETRAGRKRTGSHHGSLSAPMPATVLRIHTEAGAQVKRGDTLILLEAMKMELPIRATGDGTVTEVRCREGELVQPGTTLIEIDEAEA